MLGVSTFTRYSGFSADDVKVNNRDLTLSGEYSTTGDIVVEDGASLTVVWDQLHVSEQLNV